MTASRDRSLRCTSVVRDSRSFEMSQGSLTKKANLLSLPLSALKFPSITAISYSSSRSKDWDDILTAHTDETFARTWTMQSKRLGKHTLGFAEDAKSKGKEKRALGSVKVMSFSTHQTTRYSLYLQAVCVSACGNFGVASSSNGLIHMWNMQSGIKRRSFDVGPCPPDVTNRFRLGGKKTSVSRSITGLSTDALNTLLIATTLDGTINVSFTPQEFSFFFLLMKWPSFSTLQLRNWIKQWCYHPVLSRYNCSRTAVCWQSVAMTWSSGY